MRELVAQGVQNGREIARTDVVQLHPLLEHGTGLHSVVNQLVELTAVEAGRARKPDARQLHADQVELLLLHQDEVSTVRVVNRHARIVDGAQIRAREVGFCSVQDRGRNFGDVDLLPGVTGQRTQRRARAEPDHEQVPVVFDEQRRVVREEAL
ncbi:MAG TPA: hypothetical protein VHM25_16555, partial [Polyangiaceae bacterium]|nr:hypothetical protein [Polyangiaceae bacterium]